MANGSCACPLMRKPFLPSNTKFQRDIIFPRERGEGNETNKPQAASLLATLITREMRIEIMRKNNKCDLYPKLRISIRN